MYEIDEKDPVLLYFTSPDCSVCKVLKPKIKEFIPAKFPEMKLEFIDVSRNPSAAARFGVFTVPVMLIFFEGREFIRKVRNINISELERELERPYRLYFE